MIFNTKSKVINEVQAKRDIKEQDFISKTTESSSLQMLSLMTNMKKAHFTG